MKALSIQTKLFGLISTSLVFTIIIGLSGQVFTGRLNKIVSSLQINEVEADLAGRLLLESASFQQFLLVTLTDYDGNQDHSAAFIKEFNLAFESLNKPVLEFGKQKISTDREKDAATILMEKWTGVQVGMTDIVTSAEKHSLTKDSATEKIASLTQKVNDFKSQASLIKDIYMTEVSEVVAASSEIQNRSSMMLLFLLAVSVIISVCSLWIARGIVAQLRRAANQLQEVSKEVADASAGMASSAEEASTSTSEQAASIQEAVASMAEAQTMVRQTTENATESYKATESVSAETKQGRAIMDDLVKSMTAIAGSNSQLEEIGKIIERISEKANVINKIVDKTQLLSFNASIEAARAGIHGKGFAIVAHEVGNLAAMSGKEADEIRSLLKESIESVTTIIKGNVQRVEQGYKDTSRAQEIFGKIANSVTFISTQVNAVKIASEEQLVGLGQISTAMQQLNAATMKSAEMAEFNMTVAGQVRGQSHNLASVGNNIGLLVFGGGRDGLAKSDAVATTAAAPGRPTSSNHMASLEPRAVVEKLERHARDLRKNSGNFDARPSASINDLDDSRFTNGVEQSSSITGDHASFNRKAG